MKDFLQARIFSGFPSWKSIEYRGEITPKILRFEILDGEELRPLYFAQILSREEKSAWQAFQDTLSHTMRSAQQGLLGFFGFDVLSVDIREGLKNFTPDDLSRLVINHSKSLEAGSKALIRYGQLFALLHYRAPADWGKVEVKTHVEFFSPPGMEKEVTEASVKAALLGGGAKGRKTPEDSPGSYLKKMIRETRRSSGGQGLESRAVYFIHDMSTRPFLDLAQESSQQFLREVFAKEKILHEIHCAHGSTRN